MSGLGPLRRVIDRIVRHRFTNHVIVQRVCVNCSKVPKPERIPIEMDARGQAFDNISVERSSRNVKYEVRTPATALTPSATH